jgi:hypothetical protein
MIARYCYRMEQVLFVNPISATGLARDIDRQVLVTLLERDLDELEMQIKPQQLSSESNMPNTLQGTHLIAPYSLQSHVLRSRTTKSPGLPPLRTPAHREKEGRALESVRNSIGPYCQSLC